MTYYRDLVTGKVQYHPVSGKGATFNAEEIGEDGRPVKPRTSLAPSKTEIKKARDLMKDHSLSPIEQAAAEAVVEAGKAAAAKAAKAPSASTKTTGGNSAAGDSEQEGVN